MKERKERTKAKGVAMHSTELLAVVRTNLQKVDTYMSNMNEILSKYRKQLPIECVKE